MCLPSDAATPVWIGEDEALALHGRLLALFGGSSGLRDMSLLQSAVARPIQLAAYDSLADLIDLATALTAGIIRNHPFIDGNKRTGFVAGVLFLELNGCRFAAPEDKAADMVMRLAAGDLDEAGYTMFLRQHVGM